MPDAVSVGVLVRNEVLCRGLVAVLDSLSIVDEVYACAGPDEVQELHRAGKYDILVLAAADAGWLDAADGPPVGHTRVLVVVDAAGTRDFPAFAAMPVDGFLAQADLSADSLNDAILRCRNDEFPMPPALARALLSYADPPHRPARTRVANLTSREREALGLLVKGMSNKQIARRLTISSHGAKRLVASIMLKLDSPNRTTAAINAIKAGIVEH
jgi:two-component system nitrate/nitrite response regulator NarL